jgi:hypothetical protein
MPNPTERLFPFKTVLVIDFWIIFLDNQPNLSPEPQLLNVANKKKKKFNNNIEQFRKEIVNTFVKKQNI